MYRLIYLFLLTSHATSTIDFSIPKWLFHSKFVVRTVILYLKFIPSRGKLVRVTTAWRVLGLRIENGLRYGG